MISYASVISSLETTFVQVLMQNIPYLIECAAQLITSLASGLVAIPVLIGAIPKIITAIIEGLFSVDWLKVGLDIIGGIGKGLWNGIKSLFSGGEEAGTELSAGISSGISSASFIMYFAQ